MSGKWRPNGVWEVLGDERGRVYLEASPGGAWSATIARGALLGHGEAEGATPDARLAAAKAAAEQWVRDFARGLLREVAPPEQPAPAPSPKSRPVMPAVLALLADAGVPDGHPLRALLAEREAKGLDTYPTTLHTHNGRDALKDCAEELADALMYTMQWGMESGCEGARRPVWLPSLLRAACIVAQAAGAASRPAPAA